MSLGIAGCSPAGTAIGAGAGVAGAAMSERGLDGTMEDIALDAAIRRGWAAHKADWLTRLDVTVVRRDVLLTGTLPSAEERIAAVRLAWQALESRPEGLRLVNRIEVGAGGNWRQFANDQRISARLTALLTFDPEVDALNYTIETYRGVVHVMGIARDQNEADRVLGHARNLPGVRGLVPLYRLSDADGKGV